MIRYPIFVFILLSSISPGFGQNCPPSDQASLKAMDAKIQEVLTNNTKFEELANAVYTSSNKNEIMAIVKRIKESIASQKKNPSDPLKGIASSSDWVRMREIVCPYLVKETPASSGKEPVIVFKGVAYKNNSTITVDYDNENFMYDFELQNYPIVQGKYVGWEVFSENQDVSIASIRNYPSGAAGSKLTLDASKSYTYKVTAQYFKDGVEKISINFIRNKKTFEIKNLWAIDGNNEARKAKKNEILYLVKNNGYSSRKINYKIETDAQAKDFWIDEPRWSTTAFNDNITSDKDNTITRKISRQDRFNATHYLDQWPSQSSATFNAFGKKGSATVQLVNVDRVTGSFVPPATKFALDQAMKAAKDNIELVGKVVEKLTGTAITVEPKIKIAGSQFNQEDERSNLFFTTRATTIGGGFGVHMGDIPIPILSFSIPKILTVGAYFRPGIDLQLSGEIEQRKFVTEADYRLKSYNLVGSIAGGIDVGVKFEVLPGNDQLRIVAKGYGGTSITGGISYKSVANEENKVSLFIYADPIKLGMQAQAILVGFTLLDVKYEDYYGDRIQFKNEW
jgi:hypothetical protein